jgi:ferrochelatase
MTDGVGADGAPIGVLLMAYGTPATPDDITTYYTHIRHGRPPSEAEVAELRARYEAIGGLSPLAERSEAQRIGLQGALDRHGPHPRFCVVLGNKHAPPFIEDAVATLAEGGVHRAVALVLAPHYSRASVGEYLERAASAGAEHHIGIRPIHQWYMLPAFVDAMASAVHEAVSRLGTEPARTHVLFTAHSLPERALAGDPYPEQLLTGAAAIASVGLPRGASWSLCWQSAGRAAGPWRGPDVLERIADLAAGGDVDGVAVCPHGFVSEHLEILYDLDRVARGAATDAGLRFERCAVIGNDPAVLGSLAAKVVAVASGASDPVLGRA